MKKEYIERELKELGVMKSHVIAWEAVTRWAEDKFEIGTYGIPYKQFSLVDTLRILCEMRHVEVSHG